MKMIGKGRMRIAFKIGKIVVKLPYNMAGVRACFEELVLWLRYRSRAMAPVLFSVPGLCVVMPYYEEPFQGARPDSFIRALNAFGIIDLHPYNIRLMEGQPVAIDYAINANSSGQGEPTGGW